mgnify:CR=1 FL=1
MPNLSLCVEMVWGADDIPARIRKAAAIGFKTCEFWGWWNKDLDAVERAIKETGIRLGVFCVKTAFGASGPSLLEPRGTAPFVEAVKECIAVGERLGCARFIVTTGNELPGVSRDAQHAACVAALKAAAPVAEDAGVTLVLEPLNLLVDHAGYYLSTSAEGFQIVDEVDSPAVRLLFDIYHQQITEGHLSKSIFENIEKIGHFHVAGFPGRHEPMLGEINYGYLFRRMDEAGYRHFAGLEFTPSDPDRTDAILRDVLAMVG